MRRYRLQRRPKKVNPKKREKGREGRREGDKKGEELWVQKGR